jgi:hypothetical protein
MNLLFLLLSMSSVYGFFAPQQKSLGLFKRELGKLSSTKDSDKVKVMQEQIDEKRFVLILSV